MLQRIGWRDGSQWLLRGAPWARCGSSAADCSPRSWLSLRCWVSPRCWVRLAGVALAMPILLGNAKSASAELMVLIGEPYGAFGTMMPVGHAAVYLDRVCADGPVRVRMCRPGEPQGVVIARYKQIGRFDWLATPVMEFLYAAEKVEDIPPFVTAETAWERRLRYRERFLREVVPDGAERDKATWEWWESAGATFNRRVWGYGLRTTREQDERWVARMNDRANLRVYRLGTANCANFAADVVNAYFPGAVRVSKFSDLNMMTPKQVGRSVATFGKLHPEAGLRVLEVPQLSGSLRRSRPVRGTAEAALKTKRYLATLLVIQPEVVAGCLVAFLKDGRWNAGAGATLASPEEFAGMPTLTSGSTPTSTLTSIPTSTPGEEMAAGSSAPASVRAESQ